MYKAMIVEDEMLVRIGIRNVIKWDALGITLTEDAENGAQALELYRSERPDIILTDLRMPEMDGMSLIRNIRRQDKRCRFLILTCVEDFEQAQEAIAYSVSGYLLKLTMDFKEVEKMLQKACLLYTSFFLIPGLSHIGISPVQIPVILLFRPGSLSVAVRCPRQMHLIGQLFQIPFFRDSPTLRIQGKIPASI